MKTEGQKIKLIQVIADSKMGGGPKHVLGILSHIDQDIFEPYLICPPGYLSAEGKLIKGVKVFNFNPKSKFDIPQIIKLNRIIQNIRTKSNPFGPVIVHSHGSRAGFMARFITLVGPKSVYTEHQFHDGFHLKNSWNEWIQRKILCLQNNKTHLIIAVSSSVKKYLLDKGMAKDSRVVLIPNGIHIAENKNKKEIQGKKQSERAPIIGTVGNLNFQKGQIYLIEAMQEVVRRHPLAMLEIVGEGPDRSILQAEIKRLKLERHITLVGWKHKIDDYLNRWRVFVLPSIAETFGIVVLEAMKAGVPVVTTRVGGLPDIVVHRKSGLLIKPKDSKSIAKAILEVIESPALSAKFKREGKERINDFDWKKIIKQLEKEYLRLFS